MKIIKIFLLVGWCGLSAPAPRGIAEIAHERLVTDLLKLSKFEIEQEVDKSWLHGADRREFLEQLQQIVKREIAYCEKRIHERDTAALKSGATWLVGAAVCFGLAYLLYKKWAAPAKQKVEAFFVEHGITKVTYNDCGIISCKYAEGDFARLRGAPYISLQQDNELHALLKAHDTSEHVTYFCATSGLVSSLFGYFGLHDWFYTDCRKRYNQWCQVKQAVEHEFAKLENN